MSDEKFNWFVYMDERCRYAMPHGYALKNMTEEEARQKVLKDMVDWGFNDECGPLKHTFLEYQDEGYEGVGSELVTLYRIDKEFDVPVLPAIKEIEAEEERRRKAEEERREKQRLAREKNKQKREREEYERLKKKFGDN